VHSLSAAHREPSLSGQTPVPGSPKGGQSEPGSPGSPAAHTALQALPRASVPPRSVETGQCCQALLRENRAPGSPSVSGRAWDTSRAWDRLYFSLQESLDARLSPSHWPGCQALPWENRLARLSQGKIGAEGGRQALPQWAAAGPHPMRENSGATLSCLLQVIACDFRRQARSMCLYIDCLRVQQAGRKQRPQRALTPRSAPS
jgi:hypothetical protein